MKIKLLGLPLLLAVAVAPLAAAPMTFTAELTGAAEATPNGSTATGYTFVTIDPVAHTMRVMVSYSGIVNLTASHIHVNNGPGDANLLDTTGPVATPVPSFPGFPTTLNGFYDVTFDTSLASSFRPAFVTDAGGVAAAESALFAGIAEGRAYLNIHSLTYPAGEIRGFLEPVPEPATMGLAAAALAGLGLLRRRRNACA